MEPTQFEIALALIDKKNSEDPNLYQVNGLDFPKELLYSQRMSRTLSVFNPHVSKALQIAVRAQHICRWRIPRNNYPMDRVGYLKWREALKKMHTEIVTEILEEVGYKADFIARVSFLINKKSIKKDEESQVLEDVACLVFLEFYFEEFADRHTDEKLVDILRKTWGKMSKAGHTAALKLSVSKKSLNLIKKIL
ncbi:MAG: DUF4202 domain-containing protein [Aestuariibaculum sp.]